MSNWTGEAHKRTLTQNAALHLYCKEVAQELNDHGITVQKFLKEAVELDWTLHSFKELVWKEIQKDLLGKKSTTELDKVSDIDLIYEHINRHVGEAGR